MRRFAMQIATLSAPTLHGCAPPAEGPMEAPTELVTTELAAGEGAAIAPGNVIPPNSTRVFDVELLGIE